MMASGHYHIRIIFCEYCEPTPSVLAKGAVAAAEAEVAAGRLARHEFSQQDADFAVAPCEGGASNASADEAAASELVLECTYAKHLLRLAPP